jgi:hypothetical protein
MWVYRLLSKDNDNLSKNIRLSAFLVWNVPIFALYLKNSVLFPIFVGLKEL